MGGDTIVIHRINSIADFNQSSRGDLLYEIQVSFSLGYGC
jgi:hypothetical protein